MAERDCRIAVLISGSGSNLQAILDGCASGAIPARVALVVSNRDDAAGLARARRAGVPATVVNHRRYPDRQSFDAALQAAIEAGGADLVVLAGFMRILGSGFVRHYQGRLLNIHPSLLPKYRGLDTHQRALAAGDVEAGATVHFVTDELDGGAPVLQASVSINEGDDAAALAARVLAREHIIYPLAVRWFAEGRLRLRDGRAWLDDTPLPLCGYRYEKDAAT